MDQVRVGVSLGGGFIRGLELAGGGEVGVGLVAFLRGFLFAQDGHATFLSLSAVTEGLDGVLATVLVIPGNQFGEGGSVQVRAGFHVSLQGVGGSVC